MTITGGCLCREIRYESASDPVITRICWCRVCQYLGAGSGTVNVCFPAWPVALSYSARRKLGPISSSFELELSMTPKSRSPPSLHGHHKRLAGPALTTKFSKLTDNRRPLHEFSQHDHAAGFDPFLTLANGSY